MLLTPRFDMVLFLMTNICNLTCKHCYVNSSPRGEFGFSLNKMETVLDDIYQSIGPVRIALSGGEPLARPKDALALLRRANRVHPLLLLTNGTLISRTIAEELAELNLTIRISIDGSNPTSHDYVRGKGSFLKSIKGIERLRSSGFSIENIELFAMIPPEHVKELHEIVSLAESLGIVRLKIEPIAKTGRANEYWLPYESNPDPETEEYRRFFNSDLASNLFSSWDINEIRDTAFNVLNIYSNGDVVPYTYQDPEDREIGLAGNLNDGTLEEILKSKRMSDAIVGKFVRMSRGPSRSLRAMRFIHKSVQN